jgi:pimeloyl-ACP methyl ester carboxylesterase
MTKERIAALVHVLMTRILGYERFAVHGGDIGSGVATRLGYHHGESLIGVHLTFLMSEPPDLSSGLTDAERRYLDEFDAWHRDEGAYWQVQATKPLTLGYALNDSPAGLLAWILDKYRAWSDCKGDVESRFTRFELLSIVSLFWFTETIGSSMSLYFDNRNREPLPTGARVETPTAVAIFPNEFRPEGCAPRALAERTFNVVRWRTYASGGHFAALEEPLVLADDITDFLVELA